MDTPSNDYLTVSSSPASLRSRSPGFAASGAAYAALRKPARVTPRRLPHASLLQRLQRRPKLLLGAIALASLAYALWHVFGVADLVVMMRYKMRDRAYENGWVKGCGLRKKPLVFVKGDGQVSVVWEMNCPSEVRVRWGRVELSAPRGPWWNRRRRRRRDGEVKEWMDAAVKRAKVPDATSTHYAFRSHLTDLVGAASYTYSISFASTPLAPLVSHTFPFLGPSASSPHTLVIGAVADNQFNLRTFHRLLSRLLASSPAPSLLLHAGDAVQNPHDLPQWQTDFWDPLTSFLPVRASGQTVPIVLARGNHDWDPSGQNYYSGGSPSRSDWSAHLEKTYRHTNPHRGTFFAYSLHERARVVVLDSNLVGEEEQREQEEWLEWECRKDEWRRATLRIVLVHVPPFLEFWDRKSWIDGGESEWGSFVRRRLTSILALHSATLVLSGHSHAYSRGFLPLALHPSFTSSLNSSSLPPLAVAAAHERGWQKASSSTPEPGVIYTVLGGAGGTLDEDLVEDWAFYERSVKGKHHFVRMELEFGSGDREKERRGKRVYRVGPGGACGEGEKQVMDSLEWKAVGLEGELLDVFRVEAEGCV